MGQNNPLIHDGDFTAAFDALISSSLQEWKIPGASIAVIQDGKVISKGYGLSRMPNEPVEPSTLFNCASMTKAFVATAVSLFVDDDRFPEVKWDTPVHKLLGDDFVLSDESATGEVTIEDLLSHRSGLPDHDDALYGIHAREPDTPKSVTRKLRHLPLNKPLRTTFQYSNVMYTVAAHLVEVLSGQWLGDFLRERIWEPLKMKSTFYGIGDLKKRGKMRDMAMGYGWSEEVEEFFEVPYCDQPEASGSGEQISNVLDYAEFLRCMIDRIGPIPEEGHKELVKPRMIVGDEQMPFMSHQLYALGWQVDTYHGETIINHDGGTNAFGGNMMFLPRWKWGLVIFGNTSSVYPLHQKICWALVDELLAVPGDRRFDWDGHLKKVMEEPLAAKEDLSPDLHAASVPLALPLRAYSGRYSHHGYGIMNVELKDGGLEIDCTDRTWRFTLWLEHVSGEFFVAHGVDTEIQEKRDPQRAQFRLGPNGRVESFGVEMVRAMAVPVWFRRRDS